MRDSFAEFVATRSARLLRVAYLLTRDWALAEDLLQTSLAKTWSAWRRIEGDPEPYVRKVLVNTYTSWWRRRWTAERPTEILPEVAGADRHREVDDRDHILRALGRLPRQQRAVLILRYYEDLSEAEIAETLGISSGTVKSHAAKGLANLRLDESITAVRLQPDGEEPAGTARLAAVTERVHQRRRQKVTAAVAACAVVIALILGYAISPARRSAPQPATTPSPETFPGFPLYQMGTRLAATTMVSMNQPESQLTWKATTTALTSFIHCSSTTPHVTVFLAMTIGTNSLGEIACNSGPGGLDMTGAANTWAAQTVADAGLMNRGTIDVRIVRAEPTDGHGLPVRESVPVPEDFVAHVAVGEAVPFDAYPFPPKPSRLPQLFTNGFDSRVGSLSLTSDPDDPLRPMALEFAWGDWDVHTTFDAPGWLTLSIDGTEIATCKKWDYTEGGCDDSIGPADERLKGLKLRPGDRVTLTVTPQRTVHAWQVWIAPKG